jgi:hypothetical protein
MKSMPRTLLLFCLALLASLNSPALAFVCAPDCKTSRAGMELCLKACAKQRSEDGRAVLRNRVLCDVGFQAAGTLVSAEKFEIQPLFAAFPQPALRSLSVPSSPEAFAALTHAPPARQLLHSHFLPVSPQNAPPQA